jgi:hypothetical protein
MVTPEQQTALDQLFPPIKNGNGVATAVPAPPLLSDLLQLWLGVSGEQVQAYVNTLFHQRHAWEARFLDWAEGNPLEAAFGFLGAAAAAFYAAERHENPKINTYIDAFYYIATCASVGYADVFAVTQTGKAIAALVMVVGPGLADRTLNRPPSP